MNILAQQIDELNQNLTQQVPAEILMQFGQSIEDLKKLQLENSCIALGDIFPDFELVNTENQRIPLKELLKKGSVILSFFRGTWCPYCNLELRAFQNQLNTLESISTTLVGISPQLPSYNATLKNTHQLDFDLLTDHNNDLAKQVGIAFQLQDYVIPIYKNLGIDLITYNGTAQLALPIPAVFVLDSDGRVTSKFVDSNYMNRVDIEALLQNLE